MSTPSELDTASKCYCFNDDQFRRVVVYLLDQIASGGGGGGLNADGWGYFSFGDLVLDDKNPVFPETTIVPGYDLENSDAVTMSWPNLVSIDPTNIQGGYFSVFGNTSLTSISAPLLTTIAGSVSINGSPLLTSISLPSLTTIISGNGMDLTSGSGLISVSFPSLITCVNLIANGNASLSSVILPSFVPDNGGTITFNGDALDVTSVDLILHRGVLNPAYTAGIMNLAGGTNSPPTSTAPGSDYDILIGRGVIVSTN